MTNNYTPESLSAPFPKSVLTVSREELSYLELTIEGELPQLYGYAFIIGPAGSVDSKPVPGTFQIHPSSDGTPLFNGDAMIYRLDFDKVQEERKVRLTTRIAKTPCFYADKASVPGTEYEELRFNNHGLARLSTSLGFRNEVNTAFLPMKFPGQNERLLITWDAGRPYEIDPKTLEVVTPVGKNSEWREQIELPLPFGIVTTAAHPFFDTNTQKLFAVNYGKSIATALSPLLFNDIEEPLQEFEDFLKAVEDRLTKVSQPTQLLVETKSKLPLGEEIFHDFCKVVLKLLLNQQLEKEIEEFVEIFRELLQLLLLEKDVPQRFEKIWNELIQVLKYELEKGIENFHELCLEILNLVKLAQILLPAARKMEDFVYLICWDGESELQKWEVVLDEGKSTTPVKIKQSMHQIAVTQDYVVLMDTVFKLGPEQLLTSPLPKHPQIENLLRKYLDYPETPDTTIYIVRRSDLDTQNSTVKAKKVVIPRGAAHFLADYENPNNQITLHLAHNTAWDPSEWIRKYDQSVVSSTDNLPYGMSIGGMDINHLGRYVIDGESGKLVESSLLTNFDYTWATAIYAYSGTVPTAQFENIYWNSWGCWKELLSQYAFDTYKDYQYREVSIEKVREVTKQGIPVNLCRVDTKQMKICDTYKFPTGYFGNSAQFVPRRNGDGGSTDGYIVCVVNSGDAKSEIWIFDAADLNRGGQGPLCKLSHPQLNIGMTVHTTWLQNIGNRSSSYNISVCEDYHQRVQDTKSPLIEKLFQEKIYPEFENNSASA